MVTNTAMSAGSAARKAKKVSAQHRRHLDDDVHGSLRGEKARDPAAPQETQGDGNKLHDPAEDPAGVVLFSFI